MKAIIKWINIHILMKKFVRNNFNKNVHYYTCEWCDNIKNSTLLTHEQTKCLLKHRSIKIGKCCEKRIKV
jgi:hypothetical protein